MLKNHKVISLCIGLLFVIVLQKFATPEPVFRFLLPAFLLFAGVVTWYNRKVLLRNNMYTRWALLRPLLLLCAAFGVFLIMPTEGFRGLFLILSVLLITFFEIILGRQAENFLLNQTLIIAFGMFMTLGAAQFYAPSYQPLYLAAVFFISSVLAGSFYEMLPQSNQVKMIGAAVIGFFCAQVFWVLNFLPFHFSILAVFLFNFFYFCLIINYYHLFQVLNLKKIKFHLFLMALTGVVVLLTTPWKMA